MPGKGSNLYFRNKVPNNRVSSGRNEGGQEGHEGHKRKPLPVTEPPIFIDAPDEIKNNPDYYRQSGPNSEVHKQVAGIRFELTVQDYYAYVYRNRVTGARYHAPFPEGVQLDVNYDETVKGLIFIMRNHLNVSIDKTAEFLREMTDGKSHAQREKTGHGMKRRSRTQTVRLWVVGRNERLCAVAGRKRPT